MLTYSHVDYITSVESKEVSIPEGERLNFSRWKKSALKRFFMFIVHVRLIDNRWNSQTRQSVTSECKWFVSWHICLPCTKASGCRLKDKLQPSLRGGDLVEQRHIVSLGLHGKQRKWYWPWVRSQLASSFLFFGLLLAISVESWHTLFTADSASFLFPHVLNRVAPFQTFSFAKDLCTHFQSKYHAYNFTWWCTHWSGHHSALEGAQSGFQFPALIRVVCRVAQLTHQKHF
jgi:hypothetical protein